MTPGLLGYNTPTRETPLRIKRKCKQHELEDVLFVSVSRYDSGGDN
jgi:hypothetical protein